MRLRRGCAWVNTTSTLANGGRRESLSENIQVPKSKFYTMVLYKLAWTRFQQFNMKAIAGFKKPIGFTTHKSAKERPLSRQCASRRAIEYLARPWLKTIGTATAHRRERRCQSGTILSRRSAFELEILEAYARALYDLHEAEKYRESARVYQAH